jgi:hypothetical protein
MKIKETQKQALASYGRSVLATVLSAVLVGANSWSDIAAAFMAAAVPPILRYLNPDDTAFGVGSK